MEKITKEQLQTGSSMAKMLVARGTPIKIVLSEEEATYWYLASHGIITINLTDTVTGKEYYFYTDDYCLGINLKIEMTGMHKFIIIPSDTQIPLFVTRREGLETGMISNLREYEFVFCKDKQRIDSVDELLRIINREDEWLSIETAPRDGTVFLVPKDRNYTECFYQDEFWWWRDVDSDEIVAGPQPKGWKPK